MYQNYYNAVKAGVPFRGVMGTSETGVIAAGLTSGSCIWTYRNPEANTKPILIVLVRPLTINVTAFTTAITPGRGLNLVRLNPDAPGTSDPSGGSAWTPALLKSNSTESTGVGRVASTGALTITGFTAETNKIRKHDFSASGGANNSVVNFWKFAFEEEPVILRPGQVLALAAHQDMDAVGTFRLITDFSAVELPD